MEKGFDPIGLEKVKVVDWLKQDKDNIVIYIDESIKNSERILLLNKSYFLNPSSHDIYKNCVIKNNSLLVSETHKSTNFYRNIGFYLDKYNMVDNVSFINALKKSRTFTLKNVPSKNSEFINNQILELSQIGLKLTNISQDSIILDKKNIRVLYPKKHPDPPDTKYVVTDLNTGEKHTGVMFPAGLPDNVQGTAITMQIYTKKKITKFRI